MTQPLKWDRVRESLVQMTAEEFTLFRYNLRLRYAAQLDRGETGAIIMGLDGAIAPNVGTASDTLRTQQTSGPNPHGYPAAPTGVATVRTYNYRQILTGVPANPLNFDFSYTQFTNDVFIQERDVNRIIDFFVTPCIDEMRNIDQVGTYKVSVGTPTDPDTAAVWKSKGTFFTDTVYNNNVAPIVSTLYLKTSGAVPVLMEPALPVRTVATADSFEFRRQVLTGQFSGLANIVYPMLVNRLNLGSLRYNVSRDTPVGLPRGSFTDTRLSGTTGTPVMANRDDYRTIGTPSGGAATFISYFFGLA